MQCPNCSSEMWDNRQAKINGEANPKAPDFKCKSKECGHAVWPAKKKAPAVPDYRSKPAPIHVAPEPMLDDEPLFPDEPKAAPNGARAGMAMNNAVKLLCESREAFDTIATYGGMTHPKIEDALFTVAQVIAKATDKIK